MSNPPPHTQPTFSPPTPQWQSNQDHFFPLSVHNQKAGFLVFFALLNYDVAEDIQACVTEWNC